MLPSPEIDSILHSYLTDDPVFGRLYRGRLEELWDEARVAALRRALDGSGPSIVVGYGASLLAEGAYRIYVDVPKDAGQERAAHGQIVNVGAHTPESFGAMYKRMYFVDWPMLNWIKCHHRAPRAL